MNPKELTINKFTNLFDGGILPRVSVSQIIEYYEAQMKGLSPVVKTNCSITNNFIDAEYAEYEENENCY
jgi:hypothetical protein